MNGETTVWITLAVGPSGCGDCGSSASVNPGAAECCDGIDNNCTNGLNDDDDGDGECGGATPDCCGLQQACRNLQNDASNCGSCGVSCEGPDVDSCDNGG